MDNKYNINTISGKPELVSLAQSRPDPVSLDQQAKYKQQGLTVTSNNTSIIPRDSAGNIILQENSETNPLLIIEPVTTKITTKSILRVIETRFQYYSFPASIIAASVATDLNIDLNIADADPIFARYKPSENFVIDFVNSSAPDNTMKPPSGILMDEIEGGGLQKNRNNYYITKEIKNSGKDLRFRVNINHRNDGTLAYAFFTIIKQGPNFDLERNYKPGYVDNGGPLPTDTWHTNPLYYVNGSPPATNTIIDRSSALIQGNAAIDKYNVQTTRIDVVIQNSEFEIGDNFGIGAIGIDGIQSINSEQTYWVITDAAKNVDEWNQEI